MARPEPLGPEQRQQLDAVVAELAPSWSVEFRYDVLGAATIVILPEHRDDVSTPTLFVHRGPNGFPRRGSSLGHLPQAGRLSGLG